MRIGEVSNATDTSEYTLRYYEKKGLIRVNRDRNGRRNYDVRDVEWVLFIKRLKHTGMLLKDIRRYADLRYQGESTIEKRLSLLISHREQLLHEQRKWSEYLENLDAKIQLYRQMVPQTGDE